MSSINIKANAATLHVGVLKSRVAKIQWRDSLIQTKRAKRALKIPMFCSSNTIFRRFSEGIGQLEPLAIESFKSAWNVYLTKHGQSPTTGASMACFWGDRLAGIAATGKLELLVSKIQNERWLSITIKHESWSLDSDMIDSLWKKWKKL